MRLRRETGDFQIKISTGNVVNTIRKGLRAEDFVGELAAIGTAYETVLSADESNGVVTAKTSSYTLTYNAATGEITAEESAGGSGSGLPSIDVILTYVYSPQGYYNLDSTEVGMRVSEFIAAFSDGQGNLNHGDILVREVKKYTGGISDGNESASAQIYHFNPDGCPFYEAETTYVVYKVVSLDASEVSNSTLHYMAAEFTPDEDSDAFTNATIRSGFVLM